MLFSTPFIKALLKQYRIRPSKRLGQHFLIDKAVLKRIITAADIQTPHHFSAKSGGGQKQDIILEIGPGLGVLTQELAKRAKQVIAVEKDPRMVEILKETLKHFDNVEVIQGDMLNNFQFPISNFQTNYKIVANLPYYIVAPVIRQFLEAKNPPKEMVLMVQKEVAQRICAKPPKMNLLAVSVQFYAKPQIMAKVSKKAFWPRPKVDGAIIKLKVQPRRRTSSLRGESSKFKVNKDLFFKIAKAGFSHPRKQLINNLSKGLKIDKEKIKAWLLKNKIQPTQRAQNLSVENWAQLAKTFVVK